MIVAAHQPQYLPWPGLFDKMARCDRFVFLDVVQYVPREWQNRNRISTREGPRWLTVPVHGRGRPRIVDVRIDAGRPWAERHLRTLEASYRRCPGFEATMGWLEPLLRRPWDRLVDLNVAVTLALARALGVETPCVRASELGPLPEGADARLVEICRRLGARTYLAGAGGRGYMDPETYRRAGVEPVFRSYDPPVYPQRHGPFVPGLSAVDLLMQAGPAGFAAPRRAA